MTHVQPPLGIIQGVCLTPGKLERIRPESNSYIYIAVSVYVVYVQSLITSEISSSAGAEAGNSIPVGSVPWDLERPLCQLRA